ncbi:MAG: type II secretion system F family protein [Promicromonosporaceae bacterium]|nr:type II secretion system F family protein [Promicromonosporaceae bacterium]
MSATVLVLAVCGTLVGLALFMLVMALLPAPHVDLADAVARVGHRPTPRPEAPGAERNATDRLGNWAMKNLPAAAWVRTPRRELALLQMPLERFYGEKVTLAFIGVVAPPLLVTFFRAIGLGIPYQVTPVLALGLGVFLFFYPNLDAVEQAKKARAEFRRALGAYVDLVALERLNGAGALQAMESAAQIGSSWVFARLAEDLARSRWSGVPPWDSLETLADDLGLPELDDFADIMRLSGEQSTAVYGHLRARAESMRSALLADELAQANALGERLQIPGALLGVIFMALVIAPALLSMATGT